MIINFLAIPLISGALLLLIPPAWRRVVSLLSSIGYLVLGVWNQFFLIPAQGIQITFFGDWPAPYGITMVMDPFSALMILVTGLIFVSCSIYSLGENHSTRSSMFFYPLLNFLIFGVTGAFTTGDYFNMYVWYEVMILSSFGLLLITPKKFQIDGILKYASLNFLGSIFFLIGLGMLFGHFGTLNIADLTRKARDLEADVKIFIPVFFVALGFFVKAGAFPLYSWLPASYHLPHFSTSALFAGLLTKVGLYSLIRFLVMTFPDVTVQWQSELYWVASLTMIFGVSGAVASYDIRKILSFHIISQVGYMLLALADLSRGMVEGVIFYMFHHILVKANLFLISGELSLQNGSESLKKQSGGLRASKWVTICFLISAFSLGGIPPLSGFWAKFALLRELVKQGQLLVLFVALGVGFLTLFSMTKIWNEAFLKQKPETSVSDENLSFYADTKKGRLMRRLAMALLAFGTVTVSFYPDWLILPAREGAQILLDPALYIKSVFPGEESAP